jgi:hypothetical protein
MSHGSCQEVAGVIFDRAKGKAKRDESANECASNRRRP